MLSATRIFQLFHHLLFASIFASSFAHSNMLGRDAGMLGVVHARYKVTPTDPRNATAVAATEAFLKKQYGGAYVQTISDMDSLPTWLITTTQNDIEASLKLVDGVSTVTGADTPATITKREGGGGPKASDLAAPKFTVYHVLAKDGSDLKKTEAFLKSQIKPGTEISEGGLDGYARFWGNVTLTDAAKAVVEKYEDIAGIGRAGQLNQLKALPKAGTKQGHPLPISKMDLTYRAITQWQTQQSADWALVMDSQYSGSNLDLLQDLVHVPNPGANTYVYVIDFGMQIYVINEQNKPEFQVDRVLQTTLSILKRQAPETDESANSHGTNVASKAVGRLYGLAKEAKLVSVKLASQEEDLATAYMLIANDLKNHPDRQSRSVVVSAIENAVPALTVEEISSNPVYEFLWRKPLLDIMNMGVPFVQAAGNSALDKQLESNAVPQILQDDNTPLILVGAIDYHGKKWEKSQVGRHSTLYAPGVGVLCQTRNKGYSEEKTGTSFAAPQVAGLIATYMAYDTIPWDNTKTGIERVKAIRDYLSTDASSWVRTEGGPRAIWNGATKEDHDNAVLGPYNPTPLESAALGIALAALPRGKAFNVIWEDNRKTNKFNLLFFETTKGISAACRLATDAIRSDAHKSDDYASGNIKWLGGTYSLNKLDGVDCEYKNDGHDAGALWCEDRKDTTTPKDKKQKSVMIPCKFESLDNKKQCEVSKDTWHTPVVYCEW